MLLEIGERVVEHLITFAKAVDERLIFIIVRKQAAVSHGLTIRRVLTPVHSLLFLLEIVRVWELTMTYLTEPREAKQEVRVVAAFTAVIEVLLIGAAGSTRSIVFVDIAARSALRGIVRSRIKGMIHLTVVILEQLLVEGFGHEICNGFHVNGELLCGRFAGSICSFVALHLVNDRRNAP